MPATYEAIATTTTNSGDTTVTFSSIAGTYTDLVLVINATNNSTTADLFVRLNSDTGSNYSRTYLEGNGTSASSNRETSTTSAKIAGYISSERNITIINIMNYANTTTYKTMLARAGSAGINTTAQVALWRSTSAITSVTLGWISGAFAASSVVSLYGITAA